MGNYTLFFVGRNNQHSAEHCSSCPIEEICPHAPRDMYYVSLVPTFEDSKETIEGLYNDPDISFIFLVDNNKKLGFIYKGDGTEHELKESHIKSVLEVIELNILGGVKNSKNPVDIVIHDIRETMKVHSDPSIN